jgi:putative transposase
MDIIYIPMKRSFVYLAYLVDWFICQVLGYRVSIILEVNFCIESVKEGHARHDKPNIFNTGQGSRFTPTAFAQVLKDANIAI